MKKPPTPPGIRNFKSLLSKLAQVPKEAVDAQIAASKRKKRRK